MKALIKSYKEQEDVENAKELLEILKSRNLLKVDDEILINILGVGQNIEFAKGVYQTILAKHIDWSENLIQELIDVLYANYKETQTITEDNLEDSLIVRNVWCVY